MLEFEASTLAEVLDARRKVLEAWDHLGSRKGQEVWFRGVSSKAHGLVPGIYRPVNDDLDESTLVEHFRSLAPLYWQHSREPVDDWDWFFAAQHFGFPTRLLDWTESLLVALFFAIGDEALKIRPIPPPDSTTSHADDRSPCVWMMDAPWLNTLSTGEYNLVVPRGRFSDNWLPSGCKRGAPSTFVHDGSTYTNEKPLAVFPRRSNARILSQHGTFTVHGSDALSIEELLFSAADAERRIARINVNLSDEARLTEDLSTCGFSRFALFPEIQQIGEHLKTFYRKQPK